MMEYGIVWVGWLRCCRFVFFVIVLRRKMFFIGEDDFLFDEGCYVWCNNMVIIIEFELGLDIIYLFLVF